MASSWSSQEFVDEIRSRLVNGKRVRRTVPGGLLRHTVGNELVRKAESMLSELAQSDHKESASAHVSAKEFAATAGKEFEYYAGRF